jgi:glycosyltransferase involved in cell wall biosynthesis
VRVLVVSGIWPPDVGGPASHAPEVAAFLLGRGHRVEVVTTASAPPAPQPYPVRWISRGIPKGAIHAVTTAEVARRAARADVVYTTGMFARSSAGTALARRPLVVKLTGDPAFERLRWRARIAGDVEEFQRGGGGLEGRALRLLRDATLRRAAHVVCPSEFLRGLVVSWGVEADRVSVLPNPTPPARELPPREALRARFGMEGPTLAFAGRLGPQKALDVGIAAVAAVDGVSLLVAGEGEDRARLEASAGPRVRFLGNLARAEVAELFAAADGSLLSSSWENFPHTLVEALAVGTPVIATRVGGVPEVVSDGVNGLLVEPGDVEGLTAAIRRFFADAELRERLRAASASSVSRYAPDAVYGRLEDILRRSAR